MNEKNEDREILKKEKDGGIIVERVRKIKEYKGEIERYIDVMKEWRGEVL